MSVRLFVCLSVCMSGLGGNMIFSAPISDRALIFCGHIPLVYEHLFYKYFVRQSVIQATKDTRALLLLDVFILVFNLLFYFFMIIPFLTFSMNIKRKEREEY